MLTVKNVYLFRKKCILQFEYKLTYVLELRKKYAIESMGCIIRSLHSNEFVLHFPNMFNVRIQCERRDDFLNILKLRYAHLEP